MYVFWFAGIAFDLFTQSTDMYIHVRTSPGYSYPLYHIQQIFTAVHFIGIKYQKFQYIEFFRSQIDLSGTDKNSRLSQSSRNSPTSTTFAFVSVVAFLPARRIMALILAFTSQNIKRLGNIVIRSILQTKDLIHILALCCQHNNRNI